MIIEADKIDVVVPVYFVDDVSGVNTGEPTTGLLFSDIETGGSASYQRQGAGRFDFALVTQTVTGSHTDGGFIKIDDTNMPGLYRLDVPDGAFVSGADFVVIQLVAASGKNTVMRPIVIDLSPPVHIVSLVPEILDESVFPKEVIGWKGTADSGGSTTTLVDAERNEVVADYWQGSRIHFITGGSHGLDRIVTGFNNGSSTLTFAPPLANAVVAGDRYRLIPGQVMVEAWRGEVVNALISGQVDSAVGFKKNTALSNFAFLMVDGTDHVTGKTGLTFGASNFQRSIDGGAFANSTNTATEVANGVYKVDLSAADLNGDIIVLKATGTAADDRIIVIKTEA